MVPRAPCLREPGWSQVVVAVVSAPRARGAPGTDRRPACLVGLRPGGGARGGRVAVAVGEPSRTVARGLRVQATAGNQPGWSAWATPAWRPHHRTAAVQPLRVTMDRPWLGVGSCRVQQRLCHLCGPQQHRGAGMGRSRRLGEQLRVRALAGPDRADPAAVSGRAATLATLALGCLGDRRRHPGDVGCRPRFGRCG